MPRIRVALADDHRLVLEAVLRNRAVITADFTGMPPVVNYAAVGLSTHATTKEELRELITAHAARAGADAVQSGAEVARVGAVTARRGGEAAKRAQSKLGAASSRREAVRLNERGVEHRRNGRHQEAVDNHRKALSLMRDAGDRKGEAMTENSFALALARAGDDGAALEHFERSLTLLRGFDDDETEGQVLANLGFVHERRGRRNEADDYLNAALRKLPPESQAYHRVEEQLRRAS